MGKTVEYELVIKTANKMWSGTDNDVYIIVYGEVDGEEVHTDEINLSQRVNGNSFERNAEHRLAFQWEDIGRPTKIKLRLSNTFLDDWYFDECTIQRKGPETPEEDPEVNKKVTFKKDTILEFHRKDSRLIEGDLKPLKEIILQEKLIQAYGGRDLMTLSPNGEYEISMAFMKEKSKVIESSTVTENGMTHNLNIGIEGGYAAGDKGGGEGKASLSYGFSYSTLYSIAKTRADSMTEGMSKETTIKIVNSGDTVTEYTKDGGAVKVTVEESKVQTFAIVYEETVVEVERKRQGASSDIKRSDRLKIGRRVRGVLPLTQNTDGKLVYKNSLGKVFSLDKLWEALN